MERNRQHFNQASETPLKDPKVMEELGWMTESDWCETLLESQEHPTAKSRIQSDIAQEFLRQFQCLVYTEMDATITLEEFKLGFKSWNENTSTSPSERHLGHYKALLAPDTWNKEKDGSNPGERILCIHHRIVQIALMMGIQPPRWNTCISCILKKDPGSPKLSCLRIIYLYEADLNLTLKMLWFQKLVPFAEDLELLGEDQHGLKPCQLSLDVVLQKSLTYAVSMQL